jgi:hypothetical protein
MVIAVMAMLAAIVGIGIAKAHLHRKAKAEDCVESGCGAKRRISQLS